jgi:hypothetical protein
MDIPNPNSDFKYEPLDHSLRQICLLRVDSSDSSRGQHLISCSIETAELSSLAGPIYKAVLYTRGESNIDRDQHILIGGKMFLVRENLYHFLQTLGDDDSLFLD